MCRIETALRTCMQGQLKTRKKDGRGLLCYDWHEAILMDARQVISYRAKARYVF